MSRDSSASTVAIVGAGFAGSIAAYLLCRRGYQVQLFEKGPHYPYPHLEQFAEDHLVRHESARFQLARDLDRVEVSEGSRGLRPDEERRLRVGGSGTHWEAITLRMYPADFKTRSQFGYGRDWPLSYQDLEPYYGRAEALLGVAGPDHDPHAPPRSTPYPLPPFPLSYGDRLLAKKLAEDGLSLSATPQARTTRAYDGRPACQNFGLCDKCPIGARYSPNHHLQQALQTGRCVLRANTSVRRIVPNPGGGSATLVYRENNEARDRELRARVVIVAAHTIETVRLLLLSRGSGHPDGLGNSGGALGRRFAGHHLWRGVVAAKQPLYPERFGGWTAHLLQFCNPPTRGKHGGIKVELPDRSYDPWTLRLELERLKDRSASRLAALSPELQHLARLPAPRSGRDVIRLREFFNRWRLIVFHSESQALEGNQITLSRETDRHGDALARVHYDGLCDFTEQTYGFARELMNRLVGALGMEEVLLAPLQNYINGSHHLGGCEMGEGPDDSVVDVHGRIHGWPNLFVFGTSVFRGCSGAVNPSLTMVALVLRNVEFIVDQLL